MQWALGQMEALLASPHKKSWTATWFDVLHREAHEGKAAALLSSLVAPFGFGDPTSTDFMAKAVMRLQHATGGMGPVRHGAECFNFWCVAARCRRLLLTAAADDDCSLTAR